MADPVFLAENTIVPSVSPSGLYAVSALIDVERPVVYGVDVTVEQIGGHGLWTAPVCAPGTNRKTPGTSEVTNHFPGTALWSAEGCKAVGFTDQEARAKARNRLVAVESSDAEVFTASVLEDRAVDSAVSLPEAESMFLAEGISPVLHVRPVDVPALLRDKVLISLAGSIRTIFGSPVAIGAGYQTAFKSNEAFLTGPVTIYRNSVDVNDSFDTKTNDRLAIAERAIAPTWTGQTIRLDITKNQG